MVMNVLFCYMKPSGWANIGVVDKTFELRLHGGLGSFHSHTKLFSRPFVCSCPVVWVRRVSRGEENHLGESDRRSPSAPSVFPGTGGYVLPPLEGVRGDGLYVLLIERAMSAR